MNPCDRKHVEQKSYQRSSKITVFAKSNKIIKLIFTYFTLNTHLYEEQLLSVHY